MKSQFVTYYLRKFVNHLVDSTMDSPSLAEIVEHHLTAEWVRMTVPPYAVLYKIYDPHEIYMELKVTDGRHYPDEVYERGQALLAIGVNGALTTPEDDAFARKVFRARTFRTCTRCHKAYATWFDYYGHVKLDHLPTTVDDSHQAG